VRQVDKTRLKSEENEIQGQRYRGDGFGKGGHKISNFSNAGLKNSHSFRVESMGSRMLLIEEKEE
jgi:hypothetical protein